MEGHGGGFNPAEFVDYVAASGPAHPAWAWFTWDDLTAAEAHRVDEARAFVSDLKISFSVEEIGGGQLKIRTVETPMVISPMYHRVHGGGYVSVTGERLPDLAAEGAIALGAFLRRYGSVAALAGCNIAALEEVRVRLAAFGQPPIALAAE
jgi:hypothetical protein